MFILIECVDRSISATKHKTYEDAWKAMRNAMFEVDPETEKNYNKLKDENGYVDSTSFEVDFGISEFSAWSNAPGDSECDWKIMEF